VSSHRQLSGRSTYGATRHRAVGATRHRAVGATRHRAPGTPKSRYAAVVSTALLGAGVVVLGSAAAAPRHQPATAASWHSVDSPVAGLGLDDGMPLVHGSILRTAAASQAQRASRSTARAALPAPATPAFAHPGTGVLTSCFCWRWGAFHDGIDLAAPLGAPIYAATDGVVTQAGPDPGYGNLIVVLHAGNTVTFYGHEEQILVKVGQHVRAGQRIALVGNLGYSTGPHLHFGVRVNGVGVDPIPWLARHRVKI